MIQKKRTLKLYHGIIVIVLAAIDIFILGDYLAGWFGFYGTLLGELVLLVLAVGAVLIFNSDMKKVFPVRRLRACQVFGTLVFWLGTLFVTMLVAMLMTLLFPQEMAEVSEGISGAMMSVPFFVAFLVVVISPAICEEAVFRGVFFNSLFKPGRNKWILIFVTAAVFGAFHGSIWRFFPTFFLGIAMGYVLMETGNIFYTVLFHGVNNFLSLMATYWLEIVSRAGGMYDMDAVMEQSNELIQMPLYIIGQYLAFFGGSGIVLLYIGNYLLHKGQPGYDKGLFPKEKQHTLIALVAAAVGCVVVGMMLAVGSMLLGGGFKGY